VRPATRPWPRQRRRSRWRCPDDLNARLRELAGEFRAAIDADLARQDEDAEDRDVERDIDLG
jgi:hypothetical protein